MHDAGAMGDGALSVKDTICRKKRSVVLQRLVLLLNLLELKNLLDLLLLDLLVYEELVPQSD